MANIIINTPRVVTAPFTSNATLRSGWHNVVDATTGARTMALPATATEGAGISITKSDVSTNVVTITGTIDGTAATQRTLRSPRDVIEFVRGSAASDSWYMVSRYNTDVPTITLKDDFKLATSVAAGVNGVAASVNGTDYDTTIGNSGNNGGLVSASVVSAGGVDGENAVKFSVGAGATGAFGFLGENIAVPSHGKLFFRRYYKPSVLPSFRMSIFMLKSTDINGAHVVHLSISSSGSGSKWAFVDVDTVATAVPAVSSAAAQAAVFTRTDIYVDTIARTIRADLFWGTNLSGLKANETITMTYTAPAAGIGYQEDGILTNPNVATDLYLSHPLNAHTWVSLGGGGGAAGPTGPAGSPGLVLLAAGAPDPTFVAGTVYAREVL